MVSIFSLLLLFNIFHKGFFIIVLFIWYFAERSRNIWDSQNALFLVLSLFIYNPIGWIIYCCLYEVLYLFDISPKDHKISEIARTHCSWCSRSYCYYLDFSVWKWWGRGEGLSEIYLIFKYLVIAGATVVVGRCFPGKVESRLSAVRTGGFLLPPAFSTRIPADFLSLSMAHLPGSFPFK